MSFWTFTFPHAPARPPPPPPLYFLTSPLAGSKVADETPVKYPNVTLGDEHAELDDFSLVLPQPNLPPSQTNSSKSVPVPLTENPGTSAPPAAIPDTSREPSAEVSTRNDTSREPSAEVPTPKRYPTRVRKISKRLTEEI